MCIKDLVESSFAGEENGGSLLNAPLTEADEISADANSSARDKGEGEDIAVRAARPARNPATAAP